MNTIREQNQRHIENTVYALFDDSTVKRLTTLFEYWKIKKSEAADYYKVDLMEYTLALLEPKRRVHKICRLVESFKLNINFDNLNGTGVRSYTHRLYTAMRETQSKGDYSTAFVLERIFYIIKGKNITLNIRLLFEYIIQMQIPNKV